MLLFWCFCIFLPKLEFAIFLLSCFSINQKRLEKSIEVTWGLHYLPVCLVFFGSVYWYTVVLFWKESASFAFPLVLLLLRGIDTRTKSIFKFWLDSFCSSEVLLFLNILALLKLSTSYPNIYLSKRESTLLKSCTIVDYFSGRGLEGYTCNWFCHRHYGNKSPTLSFMLDFCRIRRKFERYPLFISISPLKVL